MNKATATVWPSACARRLASGIWTPNPKRSRRLYGRDLWRRLHWARPP